MKKFNKTELTKFLIELQDTCDLRANALATEVVKKLKLRKLHQKLTGNPDSAYRVVRYSAYRLASLMQKTTLDTIAEQQRPGGLLSKV